MFDVSSEAISNLRIPDGSLVVIYGDQVSDRTMLAVTWGLRMQNIHHVKSTYFVPRGQGGIPVIAQSLHCVFSAYPICGQLGSDPLRIQARLSKGVNIIEHAFSYHGCKAMDLARACKDSKNTVLAVGAIWSNEMKKHADAVILMHNQVAHIEKNPSILHDWLGGVTDPEDKGDPVDTTGMVYNPYTNRYTWF